MFIIGTLSVPWFNVLKYLVLNLILWPLLEFLLANVSTRRAKLDLLLGTVLRWRETRLGPWLLHGKYYSFRSRLRLIGVGLIMVSSSLLLEFGFDSVNFPIQSFSVTDRYSSSLPNRMEACINWTSGSRESTLDVEKATRSLRSGNKEILACGKYTPDVNISTILTSSGGEFGDRLVYGKCKCSGDARIVDTDTLCRSFETLKVNSDEHSCSHDDFIGRELSVRRGTAVITPDVSTGGDGIIIGRDVTLFIDKITSGGFSNSMEVQKEYYSSRGKIMHSIPIDERFVDDGQVAVTQDGKLACIFDGTVSASVCASTDGNGSRTLHRSKVTSCGTDDKSQSSCMLVVYEAFGVLSGLINLLSIDLVEILYIGKFRGIMSPTYSENDRKREAERLMRYIGVAETIGGTRSSRSGKKIRFDTFTYASRPEVRIEAAIGISIAILTLMFVMVSLYIKERRYTRRILKGTNVFENGQYKSHAEVVREFRRVRIGDDFDYAMRLFKSEALAFGDCYDPKPTSEGVSYSGKHDGITGHISIGNDSDEWTGIPIRGREIQRQSKGGC